MLHPAALLTAEEARSADEEAIASGKPAESLMEDAGKAVAALISQEFRPRPIIVVCGIGNNGGDGFVAARILNERKWPVTVAVVGDTDELTGAAKAAKDKWNMSGGATRTFTPSLLKENKLIVDAIFGTGLSRQIEGTAMDAINAINNSNLPVVSVDIASGVNANTGEIMGVAVRAMHTVSFVRPKLGHVLLPGKAHTGELHVYDIGIKGEKVEPTYSLNMPELWKKTFPFPPADAHKYMRGHAIIFGGPMTSTGASRLAAQGALRSGSGLVSVASSLDALPIYAMTLTAVMTKPVSNTAQMKALMEDPRITASLIGPGYGVSDATRDTVLHLLSLGKPCVLDADALTSFEGQPEKLFSAIEGPVVLTPHEGEFERLFNVKGPKHIRVREAARQSNAVIILKGNDTVIAAPNGKVAVNVNARPWLATAGTGDVLAGIVTGLLAQGMPAFDAACAATWIHGEAGNIAGPGMIAEDLPRSMHPVIKGLYND